MGVTLTIDLMQLITEDPAFAMDVQPVHLVEELAQYRRKTDRLARVYDLHRRLTEKVDLSSMVEAISVWLSSIWSHELVAYRHFDHNRSHIACSTHGPRRQQLLDVARTLMETRVTEKQTGELAGLGFAYEIHPLVPTERGNHQVLVVFPGQQQKSHGFDCFAEVLDEIRGPLERALVYEDLYEQARRDALTGLANRRVFQERAEQEMANARRYGHALTVACIDLDYFKAVNDRLGHKEGDHVLKRVAFTMATMVRDSDLLARVGGDEFLLLMPNSGTREAAILLNRIRQAVAELHIRAPGAPQLGASVGVATWQTGDNLADWLEKADEALYRAKEAGRDRVAIS